MQPPPYKTGLTRTNNPDTLNAALSKYKERVMEYLKDPTGENQRRSSRGYTAREFKVDRQTLLNWHRYKSREG
jgi:hypothetical protein